MEEVRKKANWKTIRNVLLIPIITMMIGYLLLVIVYLIPNYAIKDTVYSSSLKLYTQGDYPKGYSVSGWYLDNRTDADCIAVTYNTDGRNPFYNALDSFESGASEPAVGTQALFDSMQGMKELSHDHSYLWNGFRVWLRVLLLRYDVSEIRVLLYWVSIVAITLFCILIVFVKKSLFACIPFLAAITMFDFQTETYSFLFFTDIFIAVVASIVMICMYQSNKDKYLYEFYALLGAIIAFYSMLILPMLSLGFPIITWFLLLKDEEKSRGGICRFVKMCASWLAGYGLTMIAKIILSGLFIHPGEGLGKVLYYTGQGVTDMGDRIKVVCDIFLTTINRSQVWIDMIIVLIIISVVRIIALKRKIWKPVRILLPIFIVAVMPCVWCFVCAVHAGHGWTPWNYSLTVYALVGTACELAGFYQIRWLRIPRGEKND